MEVAIWIIVRFFIFIVPSLQELFQIVKKKIAFFD